ncbi:MAG: 50S ribosomal protein L5 [Candidatus Bathyarchaeota archaeon]|nr:50S ribosomal protein L5 [Candidatus Bathyarchaeota archaeon]MDD4324998.1 50S ribosomal protein L5 [Candidatus Bathyarchaeota archaeon]MDI9577844.1 50S ribosomal protein L5 [Thermoproteota archaeon]
MSEETIINRWEQQPMLKPRIAKVVVNLNVGKSGEPLEKANKVLQEITGHTPVKKRAEKTIRDFGIREGEAIAVVVTLRKQDAIDFLKKIFPVVDNKLARRAFDMRGNFSFGLKEHIDIPGVKYDPEIGIFGMDICVTVNRPGQRVKLRKIQSKPIGSKHVLTPEESIVFIKQTLGVEIV